MALGNFLPYGKDAVGADVSVADRSLRTALIEYGSLAFEDYSFLAAQ